MSIFSCKDTVELVSQALDRRLSLVQRGAVAVHLTMCPMCSRFRRQLHVLRDVARRSAEHVESDGGSLTPEAKARMRQVLEENDIP